LSRMNRIKVLPVLLRNKIAAGEVVERPASVVKELIENSIDADSTRIEISIVSAGKRLIRVSDNGGGMSREDALMAFERYATSKISREEDLAGIRSMGFRGEALSSIAAVSKVKLITAAKDEPAANENGLCLEIAGGQTRSEKLCPATGTTIEIKDLFFNTPARRKFLKSDVTENYHIIDAVTCEALSHFEIGFVLRIDGEEPLSVPPASSIKERITQIYGKAFANELLETSAGDSEFYVHAFIGKASNLRSNKNGQFLFINNRPVRDQAVNHAVYTAYNELLPKGRHPIYFLFLNIDPEKVDVNVHPAKREVRFEDRTGIYNFILRTVREALSAAGMDFISETDKGERIKGHYSLANAPVDNAGAAFNNEANRVLAEWQHGMDIPQIAEALALPYEVGAPFLYLGETFVAIPEKGGLAVIDYHAAHERVNYERLLIRKEAASHRMLFPQQVKLGPREYNAVLNNLQLLSDFSIEIEDFGHGTIIVRSLPEVLKDADVGALLMDAASCMADGGVVPQKAADPLSDIRRNVAARLACHSSVRGREIPDRPQIEELLRDLGACEEPDRCPHGRPTRIRISMSEMKKMFRK